MPYNIGLGFATYIYMGGSRKLPLGCPDNVQFFLSVFNHQRIYQRLVRTSPEKLLDLRVQLLFEWVSYQNFLGNPLPLDPTPNLPSGPARNLCCKFDDVAHLLTRLYYTNVRKDWPQSLMSVCSKTDNLSKIAIDKLCLE